MLVRFLVITELALSRFFFFFFFFQSYILISLPPALMNAIRRKLHVQISRHENIVAKSLRAEGL